MAGVGDLRMVIKGAKKMGFNMIAALFEAYVDIKVLLNADGWQGPIKKKKGNTRREARGAQTLEADVDRGVARSPRHHRGRVEEVPDPHM